MRGWPFVGREKELDAFRSALTRPAVTGVVLVGDAGVGKTRLARESLEMLEAEGWWTGWVGATEVVRSVPFGAVAHLLPDDWAPGGGRLSVLSAVAARLRGLGGRGRVALGFDDAHLLDEGSAALLGYLASQRLAFVVVTARSGVVCPDSVTALWKEAVADRIEVTALPAYAVDRLVDHVLGGDVEGLTRQVLHRVAGGSPLALRELVSGAVADGALHQIYGVWRMRDRYRPGWTVRELIEGRLRPLDADTRRALEVLACGEPLSLSLVEELVTPAGIDAAQETGLATVDQDGGRPRMRLAHPLHGEVLRAALPVSRARRIWRQLAQAALATPLLSRDGMLRAALWQVEAGAVNRPDVVRNGAREAVDRSDLALAERLARAAREAEPCAEADRLLARILECRGRSAEAVAVLPPDPPPPGGGRVRWAMTRAETLYWGAGDAAGALQVLGQVAAEPDSDLAEGTRLWILLFDGRCGEALAVARRLLASSSTSPRGVITATAAGTAAAGFLGLRDVASVLHERGHAVATAHHATWPWGIVEVGYARYVAHLVCGELDQAWAVADTRYRRSLAGQAPLLPDGWLGLRGLVEISQGRPASGSRSLRESVAALAEDNTFRIVRVFLGGLAMASALAGDGSAARSWMDEADRRATAANRLFAPWLELWQAWTMAAGGLTSHAVVAARRAVDLAVAAGLPTVEAVARYDVVRLGGTGQWIRLGELHASLGLPLTAALACAARGLETMDGDLLAEATTAFESLGRRLHAAEAASSAAAAYRRAGRRGRASLALEWSLTLRDACEAATTPLLRRDQVNGLLTPREREVAQLAVQHSSRQIAQRLGLSLATVNNNLARAYAKLGIAGRAQLRALLDGPAGRGATKAQAEPDYQDPTATGGG